MDLPPEGPPPGTEASMAGMGYIAFQGCGDIPADGQVSPPLDFAAQTVQPVAKASSKALVIIPLCRKGDRVGIERQLQAGASVMETDVEGNTPLHVAVEAPKNEVATLQCLLENGANPNAVNYMGAAPLHYVCLRKSNHRGIANVLLENGAEIDCQTLAGKTPLHFACENQLVELVEVLCIFGANTNLVDTEGNTPMHHALAKDGGRDTLKREIMEFLLVYSASCEVANARGLLQLHLASAGGYIRCVQLLMEQRADLQVVTARGETGLHLACHHNRPEVSQFFIAATPSMVDAVDFQGNTPLHVCASAASMECAMLLLRAGADANIKNVAKKTAYDIAMVKGTDLHASHSPELAQVLKESQKSNSCRQS